MNILAASIYLRYVELFDGPKNAFPENGYRGAYVFDIASKIKDKHNDEFYFGEQFNLEGLPEDDTEAPGKEIYIDAVIARVKEVIGTDSFATIHAFGLHEVLEDIKNDLSEFGVEFDNYFSERTLLDDGSIEKGIAALEQANLIYSKEDAVWFKSSEFGDEKDRVLRRSNGDTTYFASDVAYHWNKYDRKFTDMIDVFGADHHGYVPRVKAAAQALGFNDDAIDVLLVQFATLYRGKVKISMSTRGGDFVTLRQLREEVGKDAARFFYVLRKSNQHMDFDLELAKSQTNDNPVHYVQYAHARVSSVFDKLENKHKLSFDQAQGEAALAKLDNTHEQQLLNQLQKYPEVLKLAARDKEPHQLAYYLRDLANFFHTYYNDCQFIVDDEHLRNARLCLVKATQQVLKNGLALIGVSAPEQM
jgi:arginyl-tRNA synthetase